MLSGEGLTDTLYRHLNGRARAAEIEAQQVCIAIIGTRRQANPDQFFQILLRIDEAELADG